MVANDRDYGKGEEKKTHTDTRILICMLNLNVDIIFISCSHRLSSTSFAVSEVESFAHASFQNNLEKNRTTTKLIDNLILSTNGGKKRQMSLYKII